MHTATLEQKPTEYVHQRRVHIYTSHLGPLNLGGSLSGCGQGVFVLGWLCEHYSWWLLFVGWAAVLAEWGVSVLSPRRAKQNIHIHSNKQPCHWPLTLSWLLCNFSCYSTSGLPNLPAVPAMPCSLSARLCALYLVYDWPCLVRGWLFSLLQWRYITRHYTW